MVAKNFCKGGVVAAALWYLLSLHVLACCLSFCVVCEISFHIFLLRVFRCSRVLTAVVGCCFLPGGTVGCVVLFTADVLGCFLFSFPVDVVGCVLFCAWRIGVVAGVVVPSSWARALLAECGLRCV